MTCSVCPTNTSSVELHWPKHWWIADVHFWIDAVDIVWVPDVVWKEETDELPIGMAFWLYCCWGWRLDYLICGFVMPLLDVTAVLFGTVRCASSYASIGAVSMRLRTGTLPHSIVCCMRTICTFFCLVVEVTYRIQRGMDNTLCILQTKCPGQNYHQRYYLLPQKISIASKSSGC